MNKLFQTITCSNDDAPVSHERSSYTKRDDVSCLIIQELKVMASIGVNPEEKLAPQPVLISLEVTLRNAPKTDRDDIDDVLSYDDIVQVIHAQVQAGHIHLVETLAENIADKTLQWRQVDACKVRVLKPDIYNDIGAVGIDITRYK